MPATTNPTVVPVPVRPGASTTPVGPAVGSTGGGTTTIADGVVATVAGLAVRDVVGVHALAGGATRAIGALRERAGQINRTQGISVEVGPTQVAVDVSLTAEYPVQLHDLASRVRLAVTDAVETIVERDVLEVNVAIVDVHIAHAETDGDAEHESRVQ